jgi:N-acetylglucosamine-6-phosphate deacetylase
LDWALDVVAVLSSAGVVVSCGHCDMSVAELDDAVAAGATAATHLYNAMGSMSARVPGSAGAVLANGSLMAGIIADGLHVSPAMVAIAWHSLGPERLFLVTDAIAALGLPHGPFRVGDTVVHVDEDGPRTVRGVLAGSVLRMDEAVRNLIAFTGCSTADAVAAATTNPARLLGRSDVGALQPGAYGDVMLLDGDNRVAATVVGGRVVFDPLQRLAI